MLSSYVTARIAVVYVPHITGDLLLQDHDVSRQNCGHPRSWSNSGEAPPICGKV
jgi:hypothetical protein